MPRAGFEPATTRSSAERSPRLSYLGTVHGVTHSRMKWNVLKVSEFSFASSVGFWETFPAAHLAKIQIQCKGRQKLASRSRKFSGWKLNSQQNIDLFPYKESYAPSSISSFQLTSIENLWSVSRNSPSSHNTKSTEAVEILPDQELIRNLVFFPVSFYQPLFQFVLGEERLYEGRICSFNSQHSRAVSLAG